MKIVLSWPDSRLNPNNAKGTNWASRHKMRTAEREGAYWRTKEVIADTPDSVLAALAASASVALDITFVAPNKRPRDLDNLLAALKPALDGIAQAIGFDDRAFDRIVLNRGFGAGQGRVVVELEPIK